MDVGVYGAMGSAARATNSRYSIFLSPHLVLSLSSKR
jgi:hypothetical protein